MVTHKRAYEVELYRAYTTDQYRKYDIGEKEEYQKDGWSYYDSDSAIVNEQRADTGDIIWMDHTTGGHMTPIWNSELTNYFLSYPMDSANVELDADGNPRKDSQGNYIFLGNDRLQFRATLRPEEEERATVSVKRTTVDPVTKVRDVTPEMDLHFNGQTHT